MTSIVLQRVAGKDASKQFWKYHNESILKKYAPKLHLGSLDTKPAGTGIAASKPEERPKELENKHVVQAEANPGVIAPQPGPAAVEEKPESEALEQYGDLVPFADPSWYQTVRRLCKLKRLPHTHSLLVSLTLLQSDPRRSPCRGPRLRRERDHAQCERLGRSEINT